MPTRNRQTKIKAEIRPNDRGGWEIGLPGEPLGWGNLPTWQDAHYIATRNYEESAIRVVHERPTFNPPAPLTSNPPSHDHPRNRRAARAAV